MHGIGDAGVESTTRNPDAETRGAGMGAPLASDEGGNQHAISMPISVQSETWAREWGLRSHLRPVQAERCPVRLLCAERGARGLPHLSLRCRCPAAAGAASALRLPVPRTYGILACISMMQRPNRFRPARQPSLSQVELGASSSVVKRRHPCGLHVGPPRARIYGRIYCI